MYFEVKIFKAGVRRFENLDNYSELQEFCNVWSEKGYNKLVVKAFDCQGFKSRSFFNFDGNVFNRLKIERAERLN